jgi:hypothetical protein
VAVPTPDPPPTPDPRPPPRANSKLHPHAKEAALLVMEATEYTPTSLWVADLLIKGNRLLGTAPAGCETVQQREWHRDYNGLLLAMAQSLCAVKPPCLETLNDASWCDARHAMIKHAIASMSVHRRAITAQLRAAGVAGNVPGTDASSFAAFDWMLAATEDECGCAALPLGDPECERQVLESGGARLRCLLTDLSSAFMDVQQTPRAVESIGVLASAATERIVRNALTMQAVVGLFDSARLAAGARVNHAVFGEARSPLSPNVARAEAGRADAYAAMRIHTGLQIIIGLMMMGAARRYQGSDKDRNRWASTPLGRAVLGYREAATASLQAYDRTKRDVAAQKGRSYAAQTPGYVATLQEQASTLAMRAHYEDHDDGLHEALVCALNDAHVFDVTRIDGSVHKRANFWQAVQHISDMRPSAWTGHADQRVAPVSVAMQQVWASLVFGAVDQEDERPTDVVRPTPALAKAMRLGTQAGPPVSNFYGRDYAETERKVISRAVRDGRDPEGREAGEAFGFRQEWMGYLSGARGARAAVTPTDESSARVRAAITSLAIADVLAVAGGVCASLPMASGNAVHYMHAVAASKEPSQLRLVFNCGRDPANSFLLDRGDPRNAGLVIDLDAEIAAKPASERSAPLYLRRKQMFVEKVAERTAVSYRAWSGGALATDAYHPFFSEVWHRFNDNLKRPGGPWSEKIARWETHYYAGTHPDKGLGESKLIHPWRVMYLQQGVARALLEERWGEASVLKTCDTFNDRAAARVHRALLHRLVAVYDYHPWASHLIRRLCSADESRATKRQRAGAPDAAPGSGTAPKRTGSPTTERPQLKPRWA